MTSLCESVTPHAYVSIRRLPLDAVGCAVFQRLKLLRRLQEVDLRPDEAWALLDRVQTHTSSAEDREQLAHLIRVTTAVTEQLRAAPAEPEPPAPQRLSRQAKRKRQLAKAARRRQRQGKRLEACELLAPIYGWFPEGFETADLQEARALLEELG